jgi:ferric-chelate reductase [NAD(P)H]
MSEQLDKRALFHIGYGLYIVSSKNGDKLNGQIVNTVFQVTSEPPQIAVAINKENLTHKYVTESGCFSVSILDTETPMTFIGTFGFKSGRDINKFENVKYRAGVTGCPIVTEHSISYLEAKVINKMELGTHTIFVGEVVGAGVLSEGTPLSYEYYRTNKKGKSPKNAPTYDAKPQAK